jgi:hypothetical protein
VLFTTQPAMKVFRLVITTPDLCSVIAIRSTTGWRLPRVEVANGISRMSLANHLRETVQKIASASIAHWAPLSPYADNANDHYCVAITHSQEPTACRGRETRDHDGAAHDRLLVVGRTAFLSDSPLAEGLAMQSAMSRLEHPRAIFDSRDEFANALAWGEHHFTDATGTQPTTTTLYRGGRHELVIRFASDSDAAYLKVGAERIPFESSLTQQLWKVRPRLFSETLAVDAQTHRWLCREIEGTLLSRLSLTLDTVLTIVRALASIQIETLRLPSVASHLTQRRRTAMDLLERVNALLERIWLGLPSDAPEAPLIDVWKTLDSAMFRRCAAFDALDMPAALTLADLTEGNVLVAPGHIGFIDIVDSYWANPVLSLWRFVRRLQQDRTFSDGTWFVASTHAAIVETFVEQWAPVVLPRVMAQAISDLWLPGRLLEILMFSGGMDRYEQELGQKLPAQYRATRLAVYIRELTRSFGGRLVMPRVDTTEAALRLAFQ